MFLEPHSRTRTASSAAILLAVLAGALMAEEERYRIFSLFPEGAPELEIFDDFDGDKKADVLLCDNRRLSLFLQEGSGFPLEPSILIDLPPEALFLDVADLDGDGRREVVFMTSRGIFRMNGLDQEAVKHPSLALAFENDLLPGSVEKPVYLDFVRDLTGDQAEDLVVPCLDRFMLFSADEAGRFTPFEEIPFVPRSEFYTEVLSQTGRLKEVVHVPRLFGGVHQGRLCYVLYDGTWVSLFARRTEGGVELLARHRLYTPDSNEHREASRAYFGKNVLFDDLEGEGSSVLVVADNREGQIYFHEQVLSGESFESDLMLQTEGWILAPLFQDLNSDGRKDLILPCIEKIGIFTLLRVFFTSRFDIRYLIFLNQGTPLFRFQPDRSRTVSLPLSFSAGPEGIHVRHALIYSFDGDFNGDGVNDFLVKDSPSSLGIHFGRLGGDFSDRPDAALPFGTLEACSYTATRVQDLNGDGLSDLFIHQKAIAAGKDQYDLYLSR